jgi:hypothetical protein
VPEHPVPSPARRRLEDRSRPLLLRLTALPKPAVPIATIALLTIGVLAPPVIGLVALCLVALFIAWLTFLAWPAVSVGGRLIRLLMVGLVLVLAFTRL